MPAGDPAGPTSGHSSRQDPDRILRFSRSERAIHWAVALPFMVSWATALILVVVYNRHPDRPFRDVVSLVHKVSGICLIALPLLAAVWYRRDLSTHLENLRHAWRWSWNDVRWLFLMGPATLSSRIELPHQGKFNAAEKINFMMLTATYPAYIITGLLIWLPSVAIVAWFLHVAMAIAATPLLFGHVFMATVNRDTRVGLSGMISGFVDRAWARHHYRLWYEERHGAGPAAELPPAAEAGATIPPDPIVVPLRLHFPAELDLEPAPLPRLTMPLPEVRTEVDTGP